MVGDNSFCPTRRYPADDQVDDFRTYVDTVASPFRAKARRVSPDPEDFDTMNEEQQYLFDLQGYLVVPILAPDQVALINDIVDQNAHRATDPGECDLRPSDP